jgi:dTDP-glucose 4,6-dehydratase
MTTIWIVTGGAGFIGANLVHHLLEDPGIERVVVLDALTYAGHRESLADVITDPRLRFVLGDVCDARAVRALLDEEQPAVVLHLAAESHVDRSLYGAGVFVRTNVEGTLNVLEAVRAHPGTRLVHVSTDEVYGSLGPADPAFTEDTPLDASSPYSASKAGADLLALAFHRTFGLDVVVTRCSNNYGPYQMPEKLIPLMIENAVHDQPLPVYGDGMNVRDWIHVDDHCAGLVLAARRGQAGRVYNLGGESEQPNLVVVGRILSHLGKPESLIRFVTDRPGHDRRYAMDIRRARQELGFAPQVPFEQGMADTVDWYLAHRDWCTAVATAAHAEHLRRTYGDRGAAKEVRP